MVLIFHPVLKILIQEFENFGKDQKFVRKKSYKYRLSFIALFKKQVNGKQGGLQTEKQT